MKRNLLKLLVLCSLAAMPAVSCSKDEPKDPGTEKPDDGGKTDPTPTPEPEPEKAAITGFTPAEGGAGTELTITGTNFGENVNAITVIINGRKVKAETLTASEDGKSQSITCKVPRGTTDGAATDAEVRLSIKKESKYDNCAATSKFRITMLSKVETVCGYTDPSGEQRVQDGPFEQSLNGAGFADFMNDIVVDPINPNVLWVLESWGNLRKVDLAAKQVTTVAKSSFYTGDGNIYSMAWLDENNLLVAIYQDRSETEVGIMKLTRDSDGFKGEVVVTDKLIRAIAVHPVNHEVYYLQDGDAGKNVKRYDPVTGEVSETLFQYDGMPLGENEDWDGMTGVKIVFHPTGNYAYIIHAKSSIIMKCEYDWAKKVLLTQNSWAVGSNYGGHVDGVGTEAQLNRPYGGVFVKNDYYVSEGFEDQYDFYVTDSWNGCIRKITPEYAVSTFAGRGSANAPGDVWVGDQDGDLRKEARFAIPQGITYEPTSGTFYIADRHYRRVRKITYLD